MFFFVVNMGNLKENVCRTCLTENENMYHLFTTGEDENSLKFAAMLTACTSMQLDPTDQLPQLICEPCTTVLNLAYNFKLQCEKSEAILRNVDKFRNGDVQSLDTIKIDVEIKDYNAENIEENNFETQPDFKCEFCDKTFSDGTFLSKHKNNSHRTTCDACNLEFPTRKRFLSHEKTAHPKIFDCSICNKRLSSRCSLSYHLKKHSGVKKFTCPVQSCGKRFLWKQTLDKHMDLHSPEKKFLCYLCGKAYSLYDSLRFHLKAHSDVRPHECEECGKTFKQVCHLKYHMWSHTGGKQFVCETCNKGYTRRRPLEMHLKKYCGVGKKPPE